MANRKPFPEGFVASGLWRCEAIGETIALGEEFGRGLSGGEVISLEGPLGAGKTHFVKGLARGLGCSGNVSSPTFTLVHEYADGRLPLIHFDLYRLERADDVVALGYDDYFDGHAVVAVEWGDRFPELIPAGALRLRFDIDGEARQIVLEVTR